MLMCSFAVPLLREAGFLPALQMQLVLSSLLAWAKKHQSELGPHFHCGIFRHAIIKF